MSDHLPDVQVTADQADRVLDTYTELYDGGLPALRRAARLIVHLRDKLAAPHELPSERYEQGLAALYRRHCVDVAGVCDEMIDRSGALLGRVRALARSAGDG